MAGLSGLAGSIGDSARALGETLGITKGAGLPYPNVYQITSTKNALAWNSLPFPYTFSILDITSGNADSRFSDFSLPINPSQITQTEDFSISIKPTQGGTVVTHSGNRYKTLSISGTTGVNAFRGLAGVDVTTGRAIAKPDDMKYRSGYEVFQDLRNWFRTYYEDKRLQGDKVKNNRLIFKNFKDGEFLVVELLKFTMKRSAGRAFLYDYEMDFKVIAYFSFTDNAGDIFSKFDNAFNKVISKIDTARGVFLSIQETMRNIASTYDSLVLEPLRKITLAVKALAGIEIVAADIKKKIIKDTLTTFAALNIGRIIEGQKEAAKTGESASIPQRIQSAVLPTDLKAAVAAHGSDVIINLNQALLDIPVTVFPASTQAAVKQEITELLNNPRSFYEKTRDDLKEFKKNAEDAFNLGSTFYDTLFERTSTVIVDTTKEVTNNEFDMLNALNEAIVAINILLSTDTLFKSSFADRLSSIQKAFVDNINVQSLPAVKQIVLPADVDLEQIALDELGDPTRWIEIAELNDLRSPYIVQDRSSTMSNIRRPGDSILVPQNEIFGVSKLAPTKATAATIGMSDLEKSLGVDLKVNSNFDLALANNGDLALVAGTANMGQALVLKIQYEKGELKSHPTLGVGVVVGTKFLSLEQIRDNILATLKQDSRVDSLNNISLLRDGSSLSIQLSVLIKRIDVPVPLTIRL